MGQRLNIEIKIKDKVVANSYYHWSAYTETALNLVSRILMKYDAVEEKNPALYGLRLLCLTGASGLSLDEVNYAYKHIKGFNIAAEDKKTHLYKYNICNDRDNGLIAISKKGIRETRAWEEGRVTIDITNKLVNFDVFYTFANEDEVIKEYGKDRIKQLNISVPIDKIPFDEFENVRKIITEEINNAHGLYVYQLGINKFVHFIS